MENAPAKRILLVDDEQEVLTYLGNILKRANYDPICTTKGREAIDFARNLRPRPDLIILDIVMPDVDGGDVAAVLSGDRRTAEIPVIFLTGILTKEEELSGKAIGKHCVVAKPVMPEELLVLINKVLRG
jgi:DNA-binding response OmpR family regulator